MKTRLYLDDVTEANGPFAYVPGSKRMTRLRLCGEYRQGVQGRRLPDCYSRRGSLRLAEDDRRALGLPEPRRFAVPANTLVITNAFRLHARSPADKGRTRLAIYADSRLQPPAGPGPAWVQPTQVPCISVVPSPPGPPSCPLRHPGQLASGGPGCTRLRRHGAVTVVAAT